MASILHFAVVLGLLWLIRGAISHNNQPIKVENNFLHKTGAESDFFFEEQEINKDNVLNGRAIHQTAWSKEEKNEEKPFDKSNSSTQHDKELSLAKILKYVLSLIYGATEEDESDIKIAPPDKQGESKSNSENKSGKEKKDETDTIKSEDKLKSDARKNSEHQSQEIRPNYITTYFPDEAIGLIDIETSDEGGEYYDDSEYEEDSLNENIVYKYEDSNFEADQKNFKGSSNSKNSNPSDKDNENNKCILSEKDKEKKPKCNKKEDGKDAAENRQEKTTTYPNDNEQKTEDDATKLDNTKPETNVDNLNEQDQKNVNNQQNNSTNSSDKEDQENKNDRKKPGTCKRKCVSKIKDKPLETTIKTNGQTFSNEPQMNETNEKPHEKAQIPLNEINVIEDITTSNPSNPYDQTGTSNKNEISDDFKTSAALPTYNRETETISTTMDNMEFDNNAQTQTESEKTGEDFPRKAINVESENQTNMQTTLPSQGNISFPSKTFVTYYSNQDGVKTETPPYTDNEEVTHHSTYENGFSQTTYKTLNTVLTQTSTVNGKRAPSVHVDSEEERDDNTLQDSNNFTDDVMRTTEHYSTDDWNQISSKDFIDDNEKVNANDRQKESDNTNDNNDQENEKIKLTNMDNTNLDEGNEKVSDSDRQKESDNTNDNNDQENEKIKPTNMDNTNPDEGNEKDNRDSTLYKTNYSEDAESLQSDTGKFQNQHNNTLSRISKETTSNKKGFLNQDYINGQEASFKEFYDNIENFSEFIETKKSTGKKIDESESQIEKSKFMKQEQSNTSSEYVYASPQLLQQTENRTEQEPQEQYDTILHYLYKHSNNPYILSLREQSNNASYY